MIGNWILSGPQAFWLWHVAACIVGAALVAVLAPVLHRLLSVSHASRCFWLAA